MTSRVIRVCTARGSLLEDKVGEVDMPDHAGHNESVVYLKSSVKVEMRCGVCVC